MKSKTCFIENIHIIKTLKVEYISMAKHMLYNLTYLYNIKGFYYLISKEKIIQIFNLIEKYFTTFPDKFQLNFAFEQDKFKLE
jgi:hypothetical protein